MVSSACPRALALRRVPFFSARVMPLEATELRGRQHSAVVVRPASGQRPGVVSSRPRACRRIGWVSRTAQHLGLAFLGQPLLRSNGGPFGAEPAGGRPRRNRASRTRPGPKGGRSPGMGISSLRDVFASGCLGPLSSFAVTFAPRAVSEHPHTRNLPDSRIVHYPAPPAGGTVASPAFSTAETRRFGQSSFPVRPKTADGHRATSASAPRCSARHTTCSEERCETATGAWRGRHDELGGLNSPGD